MQTNIHTLRIQKQVPRHTDKHPMSRNNIALPRKILLYRQQNKTTM